MSFRTTPSRSGCGSWNVKGDSSRSSRGCRKIRPSTEFSATPPRGTIVAEMDENAPFTISDLAADGTTVVDVTGEIDMRTGPAFQEGLLHALGAGRRGLIVDLSQA